MGFSDLGCFGGEIETPNLDSLSANGLRFTEFYNTARCWPTRATMLSGRYSDKLTSSQVIIPQLLKESGYQTGISKWRTGSLMLALMLTLIIAHHPLECTQPPLQLLLLEALDELLRRGRGLLRDG